MEEHKKLSGNKNDSNNVLTDEDDDNMSSNEDQQKIEEVSCSNEVYLPSREVNGSYVEDLECDQSAYVVYHKANTGAPCLSFDIIKDELGDNRADDYPLTIYSVGGTQGEQSHVNNIIVMKMSNITQNKGNSTESEDDDSGDEMDTENLPQLEHCLISHRGCVNRIKVCNLNGRELAASWSELKSVYIWDLKRPLEALDNPKSKGTYIQKGESSTQKPIFTFKGHHQEGFALDWSKVDKGMLASGDCYRNIHLWKPQDGATWHVEQRPLSGHSNSVEDLQWSPTEANVLASCSVDRSIRIWDTRTQACMLANLNAHESDVNVISWNKLEPFLLSGGEEGCLKVWDLRQFQKNQPVAVFKHHLSPITSVEWHPTDATVFAASGEDHQVTLWDLSVEKDSDMEINAKEGSKDHDIPDLPPQLLFIHQGQRDIKEVHWHPQMPGLMMTTAQCSINVFRTISV